MDPCLKVALQHLGLLELKAYAKKKAGGDLDMETVTLDLGAFLLKRQRDMTYPVSPVARVIAVGLTVEILHDARMRADLGGD